MPTNELVIFLKSPNRRTIEKLGFYPFWEKNMKIYAGEHVLNKYLEIKTTEWSEFQKSITDWELERYRDL